MTTRNQDVDLDELAPDERGLLSPSAIADRRTEDVSARGARHSGGRARTQRDVTCGAEWTAPFVESKT